MAGVTVESRDKLVMPVTLRVTFADGTKREAVHVAVLLDRLLARMTVDPAAAGRR